ncbi:nucleotidyltransferase family protein [Methylocucumis oryzae]|uniref:Polymerase beta nucleotidyltransferase domain-containing protein n=1 Tax=Methylocucumis oryzae TaxID=1632867 RepID=A0A0F3ILZ5_9GAMM|nr:nucleotidyltransferase domain-containing protein [Methylocucumis oryzae]KJV07528.1 hypothetical protein VZ94_03950 [Methylocucumis oryzae]
MTASLAIRPQDLAIVNKILQQTLPKEANVWVFGSRAKGTNRKASDLDLAIDAGRPLTRIERYALHEAFDESNLPYNVDCVDLCSVSEAFKAIVNQEKVLLSTTTPVKA